MIRPVRFITGIALGVALVFPVFQTAFAANECLVQYKTNVTHNKYINAGATATINANNVNWVQNKKNWEVVVKITKMVGIFANQPSGTKDVALASAGAIDPPLAPTIPYASGVKLFSIQCKNSSTQGTTIGVGGLSTTIPATPMVRSLFNIEKEIAKSVFGASVNLNMVKVTNTLGVGNGRPWTTNTPPFYTINVGVDEYDSNPIKRRLLIHELTHVWQGQHGIPFMSNSLLHQTLAAIESGGNPGGAYTYTAGKQWAQYNNEQQASIVDTWFNRGRLASDKLYPYIRDNVRPGHPNSPTLFAKHKTKKGFVTSPMPRKPIKAKLMHGR